MKLAAAIAELVFALDSGGWKCPAFGLNITVEAGLIKAPTPPLQA